MNQTSFLIVQIAGQALALSIDNVRAVLPMDEIVPVPLTAPTVVGVTTKRGRVMTVIDARACLVRGPLPETQQSVVVKVGSHRYALLVDMIEEVISVDSARLQPPPPGMDGAWAPLVTGMIELEGGRRALIVRPDGFVDSAGGVQSAA